MKKITRVYEVYSYDELGEDAKEKALEALYDINTSYDWWDSGIECGEVAEKLKNAGIEVDVRGLSFDLDRGSFLYFSSFRREREWVKGEYQGIYIESHDKLADALYKAKIISKKIQKAVHNGDLYFSIDTKHYGGGSGQNTLQIYAQTDKGYTINDTITEAQADDIDGWLTGTLEDMRIALQKEYEYLTSRESIEDTIKANEYEFTIDGKLF